MENRSRSKTVKSSIRDVQDKIQQLQVENERLRSRNEELLKVQENREENYVNELEVMKRGREQLNLLFPHLLPCGKPTRHLSLLDEKSLDQLHKARFKSTSPGVQKLFRVPELGVHVPEHIDLDDGNLPTSYMDPIQWEVDEFTVLKSRIREAEQEVDELKQENNALAEERRKLGFMLGLQPGKQRQASLESKIMDLQQDLYKAREQKNQLREEFSSKTEIIRQLIKSLEQENEAVEEERNQERKKAAGLELEVAKLRTRLQDLESSTTENKIKALCGEETSNQDVKRVDALDSSVPEFPRQFSRLAEQDQSSLQEELQTKQRTLDELTKEVSTLEGDKRRLEDLYELEKNKSVQLQQQLEARGKFEQEEISKLKQEKVELIEQCKTKSASYNQQLASLDLKLRQLNELQDNELTKLYRIMTLRTEQEHRDEKVTWELAKKALNELKQEQESLQAALVTKNAQQDELEQERCRLESCLEQEKDKVEALQLNMLKIEAELESARDNQESLEVELTTKTAQLEELEQERSKLGSCLEQEKDKVGDLQLKMVKIKDELDSAWDNQESLQAELASKTGRLEELDLERCRLECCLKEEKNKVGDLLKISDELKLEQSNLTRRLEELEEGKNRQLNKVNKSKAEMRNKMKELQGKIGVLEQKNQVMVDHVEAVQTENKTLVVVLRFIRAQVSGLVQKARSLSSEVDETRAELMEAQEQMAEEKSRLLTEVNLRIEEKREAIRQLCFSISCMRDANEELKEKLRKFRIKQR